MPEKRQGCKPGDLSPKGAGNAGEKRPAGALVPFSPKQLQALSWWQPGSPFERCDALICDGAIRSGKTLCLSLSFVAWSFTAFSDASFAICAKTITSLRRNILGPLRPLLIRLGFEIEERVSQNLFELSFRGRRNRYYLFGGRDESSAALIQGITLSGLLLDEVALMPQSFVEQALARCSAAGSRFFMGCNPEHPAHWFYREWIERRRDKNACYLHFELRDNPSLSPAIVARYEKLYRGAFYDRFILGLWVAADGAVYPMFDAARHVREPEGPFERHYISVDYGTVNPCSMGLWGVTGDRCHRLAEWYYDSRRAGAQKTDEEYHEALCALAAGREIELVVVDPSAASLIAAIRRHGVFRVAPARNDVAAGVRRVADALQEGRLLIAPGCRDAIREFALYRYEPDARGDAVRKENDHAMDDIRYFISTVMAREQGGDGFFAAAVERGSF